MSDEIATQSEILLYQTEDGQTRIDVRLEDGTVWLSQKHMAELYQVTPQNVSHHLSNIFKEGELGEAAVHKYYLLTATDGKRYKTKLYNLEVFIAVGYRVRSHRGTQFRRWATERLREYMVKGFTMDDARLKAVATPFGADYFDELLERIRDIRSSEKRFYQKITDIYATSVDYDAHAPISQEFFATVQNKLHWAITGQTAAEIVARRADADAPNMGLTSWKGAKVRKADVHVAKNYLNEDELRGLNRIVTMYLDFAEDQATRHVAMHMKDWIERLNAFLRFNEREVLDNAGSISAALAKIRAERQYERFEERRRAQDALVEGDFEKAVKKLGRGK
ncbi:MAG: virulence RhuM family protein [Humidesulfovibrio sp.]|uniref:virulence RhuM family protein n=1 Tax=Humidesulfovibrio sp. TaxID=2910988 RepID=UPI002733975C|nr:virulence RhuM family protein [Humidesulfovibrio sp.]MDP2846809.1 virulence RhuM family protein [Humidesulfovibrio sp.]